MMELFDGMGYMVCPSNSDKRLKDFVASQRGRGYVAVREYFEGTMEGMRHFLE